ncbi:uncharacterized protein LOC132178791 [Corylus avellana]|uniref:uncharacterized protein LOC132178791 n=1 Tax=Corylus avellana TaxID=13451 RepID=UPI001E20BD10|nr:uncharacterized protein LOC132178791 [Corylus avellana]
MDGNGDPFASIIELCHVSASQEDRLRRCPFARESDNDDEEERVESTGILMVSLPESSSAHDVFQTPPDGSVLPSSEEQWLMALDHHPDQLEVDGPRDAVDLGKDSDLGFSEVELTQKSKLSKQNMASEALEACVVGALTDTNTENFDVKLDSESHQQIFELNEETAVEANRDDVEVCSSAKRRLDFFLSESRERGKDNLEGERPMEKGPKRVEIVSILNVLKIFKERCDDKDESLKNVSILEICRQRGVTFPPPRWRPEGGFDAVDDGGGGGDGKVDVL